ncbi:MAG: hypothetical protein FD123_788 [Bacteroidetes bacterium]|nr:MAG: hypothetical protein FD123_788 [Bacteroidota bacterium]
MKKVLLYLVLAVSLNSFAGSDPYFRQMENLLRMYNPSYAGLQDFGQRSFLLNVRNQWMDFQQGKPMSVSAVFGGYYEKLKGAVDGSYMYDQLGIYKNHWISLKYAYSAKLGEESNLNLGLRTTLGLINADFGSCPTNIPNYICEFEGRHKGVIPDFDAGLMYNWGTKLFVSLSARHLTQPSAKIKSLQGNEFDLGKQYLTYYALAGSDFNIGEHGSFIAALDYRYSGNTGQGNVRADARWRFIYGGFYCVLDDWNNYVSPYGFTLGFSKKEGKLHLLSSFEPSTVDGFGSTLEAGMKYVFGKKD